MVCAVVGGDERQTRLARKLYEEGHVVRVWALDVAVLPPEVTHTETARDAVYGADCVVLPLPLIEKKGYLNAPLALEPHCMGEVLGALSPGQLTCAGRVDEESAALAERCGVRLTDYFGREELMAKNAVATAEGTIATMIGATGGTIWGGSVLIIGRGRLGRTLAPRLRALGAEVSVSSRSAGDMAWTRAEGYKALDTRYLDGELGGFDIVINTVPSLVLGESRLSELKPGALVVDLASKPGGVCMPAAKELGVNVIWALSLPGKWAPDTAAEAVMDAIYNIIAEKSGEE